MRGSANTRLVAVLLLLLVGLIIVDDYEGWRFLFVGLLGAWWISRRWALSLAKNLRLYREMRFDWVQVGDPIEQRLTLVNKTGFPAATVEIRDQTDLPGYTGSFATGMDGRSTTRWRNRSICLQRGLFTVGPTTLFTSDPFGFFQVAITDPRTVSLLVKPPILPLPQIDVSPGGRAGEGQPRPFVPEQTVSAAGARPFIAGEPLNRIHWRTSARRDALYIRTFESRPSGDWWIALDFNHEKHIGTGSDSTIEHAVILAASLCDRGLKMGRSVGLAAMGESLVWLEPKQGEERRWEALQELALLKPASHPFQEMLRLLEPRLSSQASLVLITPDTSGNWLKGLLPILWKGVRPTVLLVQAAEVESIEGTLSIEMDLNSWGIRTQWITPDIFDKPEAQPGQKDQPEWRITPSGRAVLIKPGREANWRGFQ